MSRSADEILQFLRSAGAASLRRVALRENRSTLWSLTRRGTVLNLHVAYGEAPPALLRSFVAIAEGASRRTAAYRAARRSVAEWEGLHPHLDRVRRASRSRPRSPGPCCATPLQRVYLRRLYRHLNATRFGGLLPATVPIRLSSRFTSRLGQMVAGTVDERRVVVELALGADLMLSANDGARLDTLLHEMAHAANYLFDGEVGHGPRWRAWARKVGCAERARCVGAIETRPRRDIVPARVPALPLEARRRVPEAIGEPVRVSLVP